MAETTQPRENSSRMNLNSRFMKTLLVLVAGFLIFIGPTYVPYAMMHILKRHYTLSMVSGFGLFVIGLILVWFLIAKKILS